MAKDCHKKSSTTPKAKAHAADVTPVDPKPEK